MDVHAVDEQTLEPITSVSMDCDSRGILAFVLLLTRPSHFVGCFMRAPNALSVQRPYVDYLMGLTLRCR
jgi:hypothetical protein